MNFHDGDVSNVNNRLADYFNLHTDYKWEKGNSYGSLNCKWQVKTQNDKYLSNAEKLERTKKNLKKQLKDNCSSQLKKNNISFTINFAEGEAVAQVSLKILNPVIIEDLALKQESERESIEKAKKEASKNVWAFCAKLSTYGITNQKALVEIAKFCSQQDPRATVENMRRFGITSQADCIEMARLCAQKKGGATAANIKSFGITDQSVLIEIAKLCAQQDGCGTAEYITRFGITDQAGLVEIAMLCAQQDGEGTARHIRNFGISEQKDRIAIAKVCGQSRFGSARYIKNFDIKDEKIRIEIASLCAQANPNSTCQAIKNFDITNEEDRIQIAMLCAVTDGYVTAQYIKNFNITSEAALIKIAKMCAQQNGLRTALNIKNFEVVDQAALNEIAKLCALKSGLQIAPFLSNFGLQGNTIAYKCNTLIYDNPLYYSQPLDCNELLKVIRDWAQTPIERKNLLQFCDLIEKIEDPDIKGTKLTLLAESLFLMDLCLDKEQMQWVDAQKLIPKVVDFGRPDLRLDLDRALIASLSQLDFYKNAQDFVLPNRIERDWTATTRWLLSSLCCERVDANIAKQFMELTSGRTESLFYKGANNQIIIESLLKLLQASNLPADVKSDLLQRICNDALKAARNSANISERTQKIWKRQIAEGEAALAKKELAEQLLQIAAKDTDLEAKRAALKGIFDLYDKNEHTAVLKRPGRFWTEENVDALNGLIIKFRESFANLKTVENWEKAIDLKYKAYSPQICENELLRNMQALLALLLYEDPVLLNLPKEVSLQKILEGIFQQKLPLGSVNDFMDSYNKTFGSSRQPGAILTYAAKIASLNDPEALECLGKYVTAVLNGNFEAQRNDISSNLHLRTLAEADPGLLAKWQAPLDAIVLADEKDIKVVDTTDAIDLLLCGTEVGSCQSVDGDPKLNKGLLGYLLDGKNRLFAVKDSEGNIKARCLLRLLWDGEKAVLYRERLYPWSPNEQNRAHNLPANYANALNEMAQQKAKLLGVDLLCDDGQGEEYGKPITALEGSSPWEYVDALKGIQKGGFTVPNCRYL